MAVSIKAGEALLASACALLKHDWVKSFLFPSDETAYVRQLHHALSQQTAITAHVRFGTLPAQAGPCRQLIGLDKNMSLLCLPSFSTGSITVGFEITECLADNSPSPLGVPKYIARFVRDDDTGLLFIIAEHVHLGVTEVTCCTLVSPGSRSQIYAVMKLEKLRAAVANLENGKEYDSVAMRRATMFAYSSRDVRPCPECGVRTMHCSCRRNIKRKAHPLDHDAEFQNLSTYTGDFGGLATITVTNNGKDTEATFRSMAEAIFTDDGDARRNLSSWAMTHAFSTERMRPENYSMPQSFSLMDKGCWGGQPVTTDRLSRGDIFESPFTRREKRKRIEDVQEVRRRRRLRSTSDSSISLSSLLLPFVNGDLPGQVSRCTSVREAHNSVNSANTNTSVMSKGLMLERTSPMANEGLHLEDTPHSVSEILSLDKSNPSESVGMFTSSMSEGLSMNRSTELGSGGLSFEKSSPSISQELFPLMVGTSPHVSEELSFGAKSPDVGDGLPPGRHTPGFTTDLSTEPSTPIVSKGVSLPPTTPLVTEELLPQTPVGSTGLSVPSISPNITESLSLPRSNAMTTECPPFASCHVADSSAAKPPLPTSTTLPSRTNHALHKRPDRKPRKPSLKQTAKPEQVAGHVSNKLAPMQPLQNAMPNGVLLVPVQPMFQAMIPLAQGIPLAPAPVSASTPAPIAPLSSVAERVYPDTRSKEEIRKARNRASAQRSNEKKKREVAKLKDDLDEFVRRKNVLVDRERSLRQENEVLKAALQA